jgi:hypothetical protein
MLPGRHFNKTQVHSNAVEFSRTLAFYQVDALEAFRQRVAFAAHRIRASSQWLGN